MKKLGFKRARDEWGRYNVVVFYRDQEIGRSIWSDYTKQFIPDENLAPYLPENVSASDDDTFEEKVKELFRGNSWIFRLRKFFSSLFTRQH